MAFSNIPGKAGRRSGPGSFPVLVGNNRVYSRCGCELVITSQETALLLLPHSVHVGTPPMWRRSSHFLTPPHTAGVRVEEPCEDEWE